MSRPSRRTTVKALAVAVMLAVCLLALPSAATAGYTVPSA